MKISVKEYLADIQEAYDKGYEAGRKSNIIESQKRAEDKRISDMATQLRLLQRDIEDLYDELKKEGDREGSDDND